MWHSVCLVAFFWITAMFHSGGNFCCHNGKRHFFRPPGGSRYGDEKPFCPSGMGGLIHQQSTLNGPATAPLTQGDVFWAQNRDSTHVLGPRKGHAAGCLARISGRESRAVKRRRSRGTLDSLDSLRVSLDSFEGSRPDVVEFVPPRREGGSRGQRATRATRLREVKERPGDGALKCPQHLHVL